MAFGIPPSIFLRSKALVIDDFGQMRSACRRMLESFGVTDIDDCGDGDEAIALLGKKRYDIVLCDFNLGEGKDGQQLLEEARHRDLLDYSAVFMMITAENTSGMVLSAVEYEPDDYLTKPFSKEVLQRRLERMFELKSEMRALSRALHKRDYPAALQECERLLVQFPKYALSLQKTKSHIYVLSGDLAAAEQLYREVLERHEAAWAKLGLGKCKYLTTFYADAIEVFSGMIRTNPLYIEPYDWLARCYEALGDIREAKEVLKQATSLAPKVVVRRQQLGRIALKTNDFETAEASFRAAVKHGKNSCFHRAGDYASLARILAAQKKDTKALMVLKDARQEFNEDPDAKAQIAATECQVHYGVGRVDAGKAALTQAIKLMEDRVDQVSAETGLGVASACIKYGEKELGLEMMKRVISNHHDDAAVLEKAKAAFVDADIAEEGEALIVAAVGRVVSVNNQGARLANEGKLEQALALFEEAARNLPQNKVISLNAAQAALMCLGRKGMDPTLLGQCQRHLRRVEQQDPSNPKLQKLLLGLQQFMQGAGRGQQGA